MDFNGSKVFRVPIVLRGNSKIKLILNYITFALSASIFGFYKLRKNNFDVIFVYEPSPITVGLPAIVFKKLKKTPIIFWTLDLWPDSLKAIGIIKSKFLLKFVGLVVSFIYNNCDLILGQSKSFLPYIKNYSNHNNIKYFPSWSEIPCSNHKELKFSGNNSKFKVVFTGNIGKAQDFPAIIDTIELLKQNLNIHWIFVGDGVLLSWVKNEIHKRELTSCVTFEGHHPVEKMPDFFADADALLVSLKDEYIFSMTIPGKLQSYLGSGKPILGMLNGEGAKIIHDSRCGFAVNAGDSFSLATSIQKLIKMNQNERNEMGLKGLKFYQEHFDRKMLIDKLELLLINCSKHKY